MLEGSIRQYSPQTEAFFVWGQEMPEGTACCPRTFLDRGRKKAEVEAAILSYRARQHPIYAIYTPLQITWLIFKVNQNAARLNYQSEDIQRNMTCSICSQLKLEPDLQQDRKPFKRKMIFPNNVSNLGTKMVFQKKNIKLLI